MILKDPVPIEFVGDGDKIVVNDNNYENCRIDTYLKENPPISD